MIKQSKKGLNSRSEANPYLENGMLPLITAPMYCVVDDDNYNEFLKLGVNVCLPRNTSCDNELTHMGTETVFISVSLSDFEEMYLGDVQLTQKECVCIDVANGNMPKLHEAIRKAKKLHRDKLIIMSGNVSSVQAFMGLVQTDCDYIRVGVGGGAGCNTTMNTGVGQKDLEVLVRQCYDYKMTSGYATKIVADGISTFINQLVDRKEGLDNGYAAINRLLYAGADLVMVGRLFVQSYESAGEKRNNSEVNYYGMSTKKAQGVYSDNTNKHSEGHEIWLPIKWKLNDWLSGSERESDYLPGFVNCLRSAMSYVGSNNLKTFKNI